MNKLQKNILIPGVPRAGLEGFRGTLENRRRVGRVGRVGRRVDSARSERMRATTVKSARMGILYGWDRVRHCSTVGGTVASSGAIVAVAGGRHGRHCGRSHRSSRGPGVKPRG